MARVMSERQKRIGETRYWLDEDGHFHRSGGPAIEEGDGTKKWFQHGKVHRLEGPALELTRVSRGESRWTWCHDGVVLSSIKGVARPRG